MPCRLWPCALLVLSQAISVAGFPSVSFIDSPRGPYMRKTPPNDAETMTLRPQALVAVGTSLLGVPPPLAIDADLSDKIASLISPDVFNRPRAVLTTNVAGIASMDALAANLTSGLAKEGRGSMGPTVRLPDLDPGAVLGAVQLMAAAVKGRGGDVRILGAVARPACSETCQDVSLGEAITAAGGRYEPGAEPFTGTFSLPSGSYSLSEPSMKVWAIEIAGLWEAVENAVRELNAGEVSSRPALLEVTLMGLQLVRAEQGGSSSKFSGLVSFTGAILGKVYEELFEAMDGRLVHQFGLLGDSSVVSKTRVGLRVDELVEVAVAHRRQLLQMSFVTEDAVDVGTKMFSTKAAGIGMFLLFLFAMLGTMYCMVHMSVENDTLLYPRSKTD